MIIVLLNIFITVIFFAVFFKAPNLNENIQDNPLAIMEATPIIKE